MLQRAIEIATEAHKGQFDKSGKEYIGHPLRVIVLNHGMHETIHSLAYSRLNIISVP